MKRCKDQTNHQSLEALLTEYASGQCWPAGNNKPGDPATDYVEKVELCMGIMMHAPVAVQIDGVMRPLPEGSEWKDIIGFNPTGHFSPVPVKELYIIKLWARTGVALPKIEMPIDPNNSSDCLLHGAYIDFNHMPICVVPAAMLILWLFCCGGTHSKGSSRHELVRQVQNVYDMKQPLGKDRLPIKYASLLQDLTSHLIRLHYCLVLSGMMMVTPCWPSWEVIAHHKLMQNVSMQFLARVRMDYKSDHGCSLSADTWISRH